MKIYQAVFQSWRFEFAAYGKTEAEAIATLKKGLIRHAAGYDIDPDWWEDYAGDIYTVEITLGACYRDNTPILGSTE